MIPGQTGLGPNRPGPKRALAQMGLGPNGPGPKWAWAQMGPGPNGPWVQTGPGPNEPGPKWPGIWARAQTGPGPKGPGPSKKLKDHIFCSRVGNGPDVGKCYTPDNVAQCLALLCKG